MEHAQMDFEIQILLGCCHYGAADAGEILAALERIPSVDFEKWYQAWLALADRMRGIAGQSAASGNPVSARKAFLRAATYYLASAVFIDGTKDPSRGRGPIGIVSPRPAPFMISACSIGLPRFCRNDACRDAGLQ